MELTRTVLYLPLLGGVEVELLHEHLKRGQYICSLSEPRRKQEAVMQRSCHCAQ